MKFFQKSLLNAKEIKKFCIDNWRFTLNKYILPFSKLTNKNTMIIGLNKDGCRPTKFLNNDCQYLKSLEFIENKNNIKYIFFNEGELFPHKQR